MTEKDKIANILNSTEISHELSKDDIYKFADALIAAGYGNVEEVEHRAVVTERALLTACVNLIKDEEDNVNMELLAHVVYTKFLRKAEKELAEEKKSGK